MPTTSNKQRLLNHLFSSLKSRYVSAPLENSSILGHFIYAICREGATPEQADRAFRNLQERFFDWNEVRVSSPREVEEAFDDLPGADARAQRLISFLQEVFETTFAFDLEPLQKKGLKQAAKHLSRYQAANDFAVSWVVRHGLGGHAVPLDEPSIRALKRLTLLDDDHGDLESLRAGLEHLVPKARGEQFNDLVSCLADEMCTEDEPNCPACPLSGDCPTGQENLRAVGASSRGHRAKPR